VSEKSEFEFYKLEEMLKEWVSQFKANNADGPGAYSYLPNGPLCSYGTTDMLISLFITDQLSLTEKEKDEWAEKINSFQNPKTGWYKKVYTLHFKEHTTAYAIAALNLIDRKPKYPLFWKYEILKDKKSMEKWINSVTWSSIWNGSHVISGVPAALLMTGEGTKEFYEWYFNWLDCEVDKHSGFWRRGFLHRVKILAKPNLHDMAGAFHMYYVYNYFKRPWLYPDKAIDWTLKFQKNNGFWNGNVTYCVDLDAIYTMTRGSEILKGYREADIERSVKKYLANAENTLNDREFLFAKYKNSHRLTGALCALAECQKYFPEMVKTKKKWKQSLDYACYI
jgi:hypothetical protein